MAAELPNCGDYKGRIQKMTIRICSKSSAKTNSKIVVIVSAAAALLGTTPLLAANSQTSTADLHKTDAQIGQRLSAKSAHGSCAVIAKVDGDLSAQQQAQLTALGADITRHLSFIHSVALTLPARNLSKLAALPFVTHLSYDGIVKKYDAFTVASSGAGAAYQQYNLTGVGVGVAVLDSGIRSCQDLEDPAANLNRIRQQQDFVPNSNYITDDQCGHGTHVSGIIAGDGAASTGSQYTHTFYGIARRANLINARVLDENGQGSVSTVLAGLQWVIANKSAFNVRVINLSLGHPVGESYTTDPLCQAVEAAWKAGIVVVCAAGNDGRENAVSTNGASNEGWGTAYGSIQSPANDPSVITVGATKSMDGVRGDDCIATYSSRGPSRLDLVLKPDIIAPGNHVISLYSFGSSLYNWNTASGDGLPISSYMNVTYNMASPTYFVLSGTSMAAPVVSGAAALMIQANPSLTPDIIKARLMASADKWLDPSGNADPCTYGAGYLDIPAALASTVTPTHPALSPQLTLTSIGTVVINTTTIGSASVWGSKAITGVSTIYGSKAITGVNTINASKAVTGVNTIYSSSVWSDKTICGSSTAAVDLSSIALNGE
jgi:serine protease AprX